MIDNTGSRNRSKPIAASLLRKSRFVIRRRPKELAAYVDLEYR